MPKEELLSPMPNPIGGLLMQQYKVLTQQDRFFSGKFSPEKLEAAVNSYAQEGWRVVSMATASIPSFTSHREELIILLERVA
jgi:uncharacterized protein DUF4177